MLVRSDACPSAGDDEQQRFAHISLFFFFFRGQSPSAQNPKARCLFPLRPPPKASYRPLLLYYMLYATRFLRLTSRKQDFIYSRPRASSFLSLPFFCAGSCVRETERMGDLRLQPGSQALPPRPPPLSMPASPISPPPSELIAHTFHKQEEGRRKSQRIRSYFP